MRIGINGSGMLARPSVEGIVSDVMASEESGFSSYWLAQTGLVDALQLLGLAGRQTSDITLGTAVVPTWTRHPEVMAAGALTAQAASDGRVVLGIGLAHQPSVEDRWGMAWERPVKHMSEYLAILDSLLRSGTASFQGEIWNLERDAAVPDEVAPPKLMLAALGRQMLEMAGRRADGTILWCVGPVTLRQQIVPIINDAAAGADRPTPSVVCSLPVCVTDEPEGVRQFVGQILADYATLPSYRAMLDIEGVRGVEDISLIGSEEEVAGGLDAIASSGATDFTAVVIPDASGPSRTLEFLRSRL